MENSYILGGVTKIASNSVLQTSCGGLKLNHFPEILEIISKDLENLT